MKTFNQKRTQKIAMMALAILAIVATICILTNPVTGLGASLAMATVVGGITLEGKEEALYNALNETIQGEITKHTKGYISESKMTENINSALAKFAPNLKDNEDLVKLQTKLDGALSKMAEMGLEMKAMKEVGNAKIPKSVYEQLKAHKEAHKDLWEKMKTPGTPWMEIDVKVAGTMLESTNTGAGTYFPSVSIEPGVVEVARQQADLINYVNYSGTNATTIVWVEKTNYDGQAAWTAEGSAKPLIDWEYKTVLSTAKKVADRVKVSTEILDDVENMAGTIRNELKYSVDMAVNTAILSGAGGDSIEGITHWASLYVTTGIKTTNPNNKDAILAACKQIRILYFNPSHVFINPLDMANIELEKNNQDIYVIPPFATADGKVIGGVNVIETPSIPQGYLLVADMKKCKVREKDSFKVMVGWSNDDFDKNLLTMVGERRMHLFIADNDTGAFLYDTLANIKTAISQL